MIHKAKGGVFKVLKTRIEVGTNGERIPHIEALSYLPGSRLLIIICGGKTAHPFRNKRGKMVRSQDIEGNILKARTGRAEDYAHRGIILMLTCHPDLLSPLNSKEMSRRTTGGMNNARGKREGSQGITKDSFKAVPDGERIMHIEAFHYLPGAQPLFLI